MISAVVMVKEFLPNEMKLLISLRTKKPNYQYLSIIEAILYPLLDKGRLRDAIKI